MPRRTSSRALTGNGDAEAGYDPYRTSYSTLAKVEALTGLGSELADIGVGTADLVYGIQVVDRKVKRDAKISAVAKRRGVSGDVVRDAVMLYDESNRDRARKGIKTDAPLLNDVELGYFGLKNADLADLGNINDDVNSARAANDRREAFYDSPKYWGVRTALHLPTELRGVWDSPSAHPHRHAYQPHRSAPKRRVPLRSGAKVFEL